jgi:AraC-like DNA-binding protein
MAEKLAYLSGMNPRRERHQVFFGEVEYAAGGTFGPRTQQDYQLVVLHCGDLHLRLDDATLRVRPGEGILLVPGHDEFFEFDRMGKTRHSWCALAPVRVPAALSALMPESIGPAPWTPHLQQLLDRGHQCGGRTRDDDPLASEHLAHLALHLLTAFLLEARRQHHGAFDTRIDRMRDLIRRSYRQPLRLADLARAAGLSKQHLLKVCRQRNIPAPLSQLYDRRLEVAADLLLHTGLAVKEISGRSGFENPFHFSRRFRRWSGLSPRAYRQQNVPGF